MYSQPRSPSNISFYAEDIKVLVFCLAAFLCDVYTRGLLAFVQSSASIHIPSRIRSALLSLVLSAEELISAPTALAFKHGLPFLPTHVSFFFTLGRPADVTCRIYVPKLTMRSQCFETSRQGLPNPV